ncbi:hypothetical protein AB0O31_21385 [Kitasatospora cineracea]
MKMMDQDGSAGSTDFSAHSHAELISMVHSLDSGSVMAAADPWRRAHETLTQIQSALTTATGDATSTWQGSTSDAFHAHMTELAAKVSATADHVNYTATALQTLSASIDEAKAAMPEEPGFWDKVGDGISDVAKESVGISDADTRQGIADTRKQQAVGVMQVLAAKYSMASSRLGALKTGLDDNSQDKQVTPPSDGGAAGFIAAITGVGVGAVQGAGGMSGSSGSQTSLKSTSTTRAPQAPKVKAAVIRPTDAGISGGTANPLPQPKGPGTGIDGIQGGTGGIRGGGTSTIGGPGGSGGLQGPSGGGSGGFGGGGTSTGLIGGGGSGTLAGGTGIGARAGFSGNSVSKAGTFGSNGLNGGGTGTGGAAGTGAGAGNGAGGRAGALGGGGLGGGAGEGGAGGGLRGRAGGSLAGRAGGMVGEAAHGSTGGRAFSEGGSGIGRSRPGQVAGAAEAGHAGGRGQGGAAGNGAGMAGHGQSSKRAKKGTSDRPDYLVEDEETWASGGNANPNVVE